MYGTILKVGMAAAPHLAKAAIPAYAGTAIANQIAPDWIQDVYKGSIEGDDDGVYKGKGLTAAFLKPFVDEGALESAKQQKSIKRVLAPTGYTAADLGLAEGSTFVDAQTAVAAKQREDAETLRKQNRDDAMLPIRAQIAEAQATRADAMLMNANSLAFQREQLAQQDRQYNLDLDRKARMDQERAFLALMGGGLDALGAAFA